jgi:hypothetical protein
MIRAPSGFTMLESSEVQIIGFLKRKGYLNKYYDTTKYQIPKEVAS